MFFWNVKGQEVSFPPLNLQPNPFWSVLELGKPAPVEKSQECLNSLPSGDRNLKLCKNVSFNEVISYPFGHAPATTALRLKRFHGNRAGNNRTARYSPCAQIGNYNIQIFHFIEFEFKCYGPFSHWWVVLVITGSSSSSPTSTSAALMFTNHLGPW